MVRLNIMKDEGRRKDMKRLIGFVLLALIVLLGSCSSLRDGKEQRTPKSVVSTLQSARRVAVLGYNTSHGLDDRLLDNAVSSPMFDIKIDLSLDRGPKFPVGDRVDAYDRDFLEMMKTGPFELVARADILSSPAYGSIKGDPDMDLNNVNAAEGYTLTYQFDNWMDKSQSQSAANSVPERGQLVNSYKATLEALDADIGIIVVQKPWVRTHHYALIPDRLFKRKKNYFAVGTTAHYYLVVPQTMNQVLYQKTIYTESDVQYLLKGYTQKQREIDEVQFLEQLDSVVEKSHTEFLGWINSVLQQ